MVLFVHIGHMSTYPFELFYLFFTFPLRVYNTDAFAAVRIGLNTVLVIIKHLNNTFIKLNTRVIIVTSTCSLAMEQ